ncbi:hypothetical protein BO70DRAFT_89296 [Aspergillus heteromorphus CBS 117.55]|uniref:Uncharacterized protein n=1 Tax=Aspergillus heteromorphus CBS 117.55 TaxID=1448321 RepID=A0A317WXX8_9EURO|nr:uncharacterized protein BO70DRAFT_89296 [Aspergillus heteromorphus CBS 117.55]PWY91264.1 hypothetical protein BO70DRAFT_89296 [Aspergillus heteromorphus CBS 117.55]
MQRAWPTQASGEKYSTSKAKLLFYSCHFVGQSWLLAQYLFRTWLLAGVLANPRR